MNQQVAHELPEKIRIARSFGRAAADYDSYARLQRDIGGKLLAQVQPGRVTGILDLGSGTGHCARRLSEMYPRAEIASLDIAEAMLTHARNNAGTGTEQWVCGDAEKLPFADDSFDLVVSNLTLQWCPHPESVFSELARVMKPGGRAYVSTLAEHTLGELRRCWAGIDSFVHVNRFLTVDEIIALMGAGSFSHTGAANSRETYFYESLKALTGELKGIGAHNLNAGRPPGLTGKSKLRQLKAAFERGSIPGKGIPVTYDLVLLHLVK